MTESIIIHECDVKNCSYIRPDYNYIDTDGVEHLNTKDLCVRNSVYTSCADLDNYNCAYKQHQRDLVKIRKYADCMNSITDLIRPYMNEFTGINDYGEFDVVLAVKQVLENAKMQKVSAAEIGTKTVEFYASIIEDIRNYSNRELENHYNHCSHAVGCVNHCGIDKEVYLKEIIKKCEIIDERKEE